jgi:DNA polymerase III gamma/tau subunit
MSLVESLLASLVGCDELIPYNLELIRSLSQKSTVQQSSELLTVFAKVESELRWFSNPALLLQLRLLQFMQDANRSPVPATSSFHLVQSSSSQHQQQQQQKPAEVQPMNQVSNTASMPNKISTGSEPSQATAPAVMKAPQQVQPVSKSQVQQESSSSTELTLAVLQGRWQRFLDQLKVSHSGLFTIINGSKPVQFNNQTVFIYLPQYIQFFVDKLKEDAYKKSFEQQLTAFFACTLTFSVLKPSGTPGASVGTQMPNTSNTPVKQELSRSDSQSDSTPVSPEPVVATKDETINTIISIFEGSIVS